jgi:DNA polymerase III epsilon subunit-like protein
MIVFDVETTKLLEVDAAPLTKQPRITEFCAIKLDDDTLEEVGRIHRLIDPKEKLEKFIIKHTGITDEMLKGQPTFSEYLPIITDFFRGERTMVAHNLGFDAGVLRCELERVNAQYKLPWPSEWICTIEATFDIRGRRMKLADLYKHLTGEEFKEAHRADKDTEALCDVVRELRKLGRL